MNADALVASGLEEIADVKAGNDTFLAASITGVTENIQAIRNLALSSGRFFTETENGVRSGLLMIGQDLVEELFPSTDPIGKRIRIRGQSFQVIGVQEKQGSSLRLVPRPAGLYSACLPLKRSGAAGVR